MISEDPLVRDARLATAIFLAGLGLLLLGAALGLNYWPGESLWRAARSASAQQFFVASAGYSIIFGPMFWASAPSRAQQLAVFGGWVATSVGLWALLREQVPLSWGDRSMYPWPIFLASALALPAAVLLAWRIVRTWPAPTLIDARLRLLCLLCLLFVLVPVPALNLTATLHPLTFDLHALHFDRVSGLGFTPALVAAVDQVPGLADAAGTAYGLTPITFLAVALLQLRGRPAHVASAVLLWVGMTSLALIAYHLLPLTGPRYAFGDATFLRTLRDPGANALAPMLVPNFPRNAMPSMHFGWMLAASILWWQTGSRKASRALLIAVTVLTAIATLHSGEHYAVDLVVAVPFVLANLALWTTGVPWRAAARRHAVFAGFGCWLAWVLLLRLKIETLVAAPALAQSMLAATAAVVVYQVLQMRRFPAAAAQDALEPVATAGPEAPAVAAWRLRFGVLFFVSGAAALVYQVLFAKALALVFGSTAAATFTVLAVFLGGMAIGSVIGGALAQRARAPVRAYAFVELGIGVYCAATPMLFEAVQRLYVALAADIAPDSPALLALRVGLGAAVLLVPTVLMGITLPLLAVALGPRAGGLGSRVAVLYFANTAGAAAGALVTGYALIPLLGVRSTTLVATMLNLVVALAALELARRVLPADGGPSGSGAVAPDDADRPLVPRRAAAFATATLGLVGILSLGLEVVYVHLLAIVAGNSVYAFGLMLATFLIGLATGGEGARRLLRRPRLDAAQALGIAVLGLGATVALGTAAWSAIPGYFASFEQYPLQGGFAAREAIRGLVCALAMVPPTVFIGAAYVLAIEVVTAGARRSGALALGAAAAVNTAGNIAGVLLFGFALLPLLGGERAVQAIAAAAVAWGLVTLAGTGLRRVGRAGWAAAGAAMLALAIGVTQRFDLEALSSGANVYFAAQQWGRVIDHAESIDGGLTTVADRSTPAGSVRTLLTNGKFQGNDALAGEMQAQVGFALAPLLHQSERRSALVIGYGTGVTSRVFHDAGFAALDIAELSADIVRLADRHFGTINRRVTTRPGVRLHLTDGRNFLLLGRSRYDVISIEITSIWFAGAASLYNEEFYRLVKSRLAPGGVLQQWVQLHHLGAQDVLTVISTLRHAFGHVAVYEMGGQGIVVATDDAAHAKPNAAAIARLVDEPALDEVRRIARRPVDALGEALLLDGAGVDRFIGEFGGDPAMWLSTDDNLELEYSTPKANANDGTFSFVTNRAMLARHR